MSERLYLEIKKGDKKVTFVEKWSGFTDIEINLADKILCDDENFDLISNSKDIDEFKNNIRTVLGSDMGELIDEDIEFYEGSLAEINLDDKIFLSGTIYEDEDVELDDVNPNSPKIDFDPIEPMSSDDISELYNIIFDEDNNHSSYIIYNDKVYTISFGYLY